MQNQNEFARRRDLLNPLRRLALENKINELNIKLQDPSIISQLTGNDLSFIAGREKEAWQLILSSPDFSNKLNEDDLNPMYLERPLAEILLASPFSVKLSLNTLEDLNFFHPLLSDKIQSLISQKIPTVAKSSPGKLNNNNSFIQQGGIISLPAELLLVEIVKFLSIKDLAILSQASKHFLQILKNDSVWKEKFSGLQLSKELLENIDTTKQNNYKKLCQQMLPLSKESFKNQLEQTKDLLTFMQNNIKDNVKAIRSMMQMPLYTDKIFYKNANFSRIGSKLLQLAIEENFQLINQLNTDLLTMAHHFPQLWATILKKKEILDTLDLDRMKKYLYTSSIVRGIFISNDYLLTKLKNHPVKKFVDFKDDSQANTLLTNILLIMGNKNPSTTAKSLSTEQGLEKFTEALTNSIYAAKLFDSITPHLLNIAYYAPELMPIIINTSHLTEKLTTLDLEIFRVFHPELENEIGNIIKLKNPSVESSSAQNANNASNENRTTSPTIQLASNNQQFFAHKEEQKLQFDVNTAITRTNEIIKELKQLGKLTLTNLKPYILKEAKLIPAILLALEVNEVNSQLLLEIALFDHEAGEEILKESALAIRIEPQGLLQIGRSDSSFAKLIKEDDILMDSIKQWDKKAAVEIIKKAKEVPVTSAQLN